MPKLSPEERKFVFELCEQNTYVQAAELIAEPSPVGLSLNTSSSALQRFCARYHPDAAKTETLGQYANILQVRHQAAEGAFAEGILTLVQNRVLEQLKNGRPLAEMAPDFRILKSAHKCFLEDYAWRKEEGSKAGQQYHKYLEQIASTHECDFMRNDVEVDAGAEGVPEHHFGSEDTNEELDIMHTQVRLRREEQARAAAGAKRRALSSQPETQPVASKESHDHSIHNSHSSHNSYPCPAQAPAKPVCSPASPPHPTSNQQKPLEIPPIPSNPTSQRPTQPTSEPVQTIDLGSSVDDQTAKDQVRSKILNLLRTRATVLPTTVAQSQPSASEPSANTSVEPATQSESTEINNPEVNTPAQPPELAQIAQAQAAEAEAALLALRRGTFNALQMHQVAELQAKIARKPSTS